MYHVWVTSAWGDGLHHASDRVVLSMAVLRYTYGHVSKMVLYHWEIRY